MPQASKTFRIFVSSTFSDLKAERNELQEHVFPKLRELCAQHGCRFQAIDLRWGVREEAALDQQTMKICLEEIARCQRTTPRPNFLVLLGDRYGWRPLPSEIPADEFDVILDNFTTERTRLQRELLTEWYRRDGNAVPPVYCLQPREAEFTDSDAWKTVEHELRSFLLEAVGGMGLAPEELGKYTTSATEQEITHGALQVTDAQQQVFCCFRTITDIPLDQTVGDFVDLDKDGNLDTEAQGLLNDLKLRLSEALPDNVHHYEARWAGSGVTEDHVTRLCEDVLTRLSRVIETEIRRLEDVGALEKEIAAHQAFGVERARLFTGRAGILQTLSDYLTSDDPHPLAVFGESGSGKSALMARAVEQARAAQVNCELVVRFIGATPDSSDGRALLDSLCREISRRYENETPIPTRYGDLVQEFPKRLALATSAKPLIVFLDALDQLSDVEHARNLIWMRSDLPENVRLIASTLPGECLTALARKLEPGNIIELEPMSQTEGSGLLDLWLNEVCRTLQDDQREEVLRKFAGNGLPLYLKLAFEEARRWKSYSLKVRLGGSIAGILRDLFRRLSVDHGRMLVSRSLGYLMAGKNGLTEDELLDALARDNEFFDDFKAHAHHDLPETDAGQPRLPVVVWSRLYLDLEPYLTERTADDTSVIAFYHRQVADAVREQFLVGDEGRARHHELAGYFGSSDLHIGGEDMRPNLRKMSELPYQQARAGLWTSYEDTLTDPRFLKAKITAMGPQSLLADYTFASDHSDPQYRESVSLLHGALRLAADVLKRDALQLPGQLTGRLQGREEQLVTRLMDRLETEVTWPWLRPRFRSLRSPESGLLNSWQISRDAPVCRLKLSGDESAVAVVEAGRITFWDLETGSPLHTIEAGPLFDGVEWKGWQSDLPERNYEWKGGAGDHSWQMSTPAGDVVATCRMTYRTNPLRTNPSWTCTVSVVLGGEKHNLTGFNVGETYAGFGLVAPAIAEDGEHVVCAGLNGHVEVRKLGVSQIVREARVTNDPIIAVAPFRDLRRIVFLTLAGMMGVSDLAEAGQAQPPESLLPARPQMLALDTKGEFGLVGLDNDELVKFDTATGAITSLLAGVTNTSYIKDLWQRRFLVTSDFRYALIDGVGPDYYDGYWIGLVTLQTGALAFSHETDIKSQRWTAHKYMRDGTTPILLAYSSEGEHIVDLESGRLVTTQPSPAAEVIPWLDPDSQHRSKEQYACLLDEKENAVLVVGTTREPLAFTPDDWLAHVAMAADGSFVAAACESGQIHILEIRGADTQTDNREVRQAVPLSEVEAMRNRLKRPQPTLTRGDPWYRVTSALGLGAPDFDVSCKRCGHEQTITPSMGEGPAAQCPACGLQ